MKIRSKMHTADGAWLVDRVFGKGDVLELGAGTGNGTRHLLRRFSDQQCLSVSSLTYSRTSACLSFWDKAGTEQSISRSQAPMAVSGY